MNTLNMTEFSAIDKSVFNKALLNPSSIALIGASSNIKKNTARPLLFMKKHGFTGNIYPVNPGADRILDEKVYPTIADLPEGVEHAFVMIDSTGVEGVIEQCAAKKIPVVTIYSDGFGEAGPVGMQKQQRLLDKARQLGVRLLGPNSIGSANIQTGAIISVNAVFEMDSLLKGHISLVSQSGSMMGSLMSRAVSRGFGFAKTISVGNECDISTGEIVDALVDDESTQVILLFLETLRDTAVLTKALQHARQAGKPVIAYKLGRSEQGDALSQSHTGAIAGNNAAVDAYFHANGVIRVNSLETLFEIAPLVSRYSQLRPNHYSETPPRVAVITTTGGGAATVVDNLGLAGIEAIAPTTEFIQHMAARGLNIRQTPVIDLTLAATSEQYKDLLGELLKTDWCDAVLSVVGSSAQFHPQLAIKPILETFESGNANNKPLVVFLSPDAPESLKLLQAANIGAFRTPEGCADALSAFFKPNIKQATQAVQEIELADTYPQFGNFNEVEANHLFAQLGITQAASQWVSTTDLTHQVPYPVVVKIVSRDIMHKTDVGGVSINIQNDEQLQQTARNILEQVEKNAPEATVEGLYIQHMESRLIELMLGYRHDPLVGPTVILSTGGITAELNPDFSIRTAPVSLEEARQMINEVQYTKLIRGYRNLPKGDCEALAKAIMNFSKLAMLRHQPVAEAEINPLFIQKDKVIAVDGVIRLKD